jgi:hypothetical protein
MDKPIWLMDWQTKTCFGKQIIAKIVGGKKRLLLFFLIIAN